MLRALLRKQFHYQVTPEILRELDASRSRWVGVFFLNESDGWLGWAVFGWLAGLAGPACL